MRQDSWKVQDANSREVLPAVTRIRRPFFAALAFAVTAGTLAAPLSAQVTNTPSPTDSTGIQTTTSTTTGTQTAQDGTGKQTPTVTTTTTFSRGKKKKDTDKTASTKDTKKQIKTEKRADALIGVDSKLPDKALYDKAYLAIKKGHFDVARLDLQTMLNTYPDSQYQMRAKLAIADSWYKEGGTAALTQAESEYADFRVFFPNAPEAAEAQMRIGDIYFRQMDRPDRDYAKAIHAEEEYRRMMTDYPDSTLVPQAKQRLRDVQEVLASREADIAAFYGSHENWAATIARYQTVADTYPLYSHMDDVLIGLGDAYEAQARYIRTLKIAEAPKAALEATYDNQAIAAYSKVITEHAAARDVEDARDRLQAMNVAIPVPTKEQMDASVLMENSRATYKLSDRAQLFLMHKPDTVTAARVGEPMMADPRQTTAPEVNKAMTKSFETAFAPAASGSAPLAAAPAANGSATPAAPAPAVAPAALKLEDVPASENAADGVSGTTNLAPAASTAGRAAGNSVGAEILTGTPAASTPSGNPSNNFPTPATPGNVPVYKARPASAAENGLTPVRPANSAPLPAVEHAGAAPDSINAITTAQPAAQAPPANGKKVKPEFDKKDESSSKHKKKKAITKVVEPF